MMYVNVVRFYYYEHQCMVYGFHEDGDWRFGIKDRGKFNGHKIIARPRDPQYGVTVTPAKYPL